MLLNVYTCSYCGNSFKREPSKTKGKKNLFCSIDCHNKFRLKCVYVCEVCGKKFHRPVRLNQKKPRFCCRDCMHQKLREERNPINCYCNKCGKAFHSTPYQMWRGEGRFCSMACKTKWQTGIYKRGTPHHYYSTVGWRKIRKKVLERDKNKCTRCGTSDKHLHVNHIKLRELGGTDDLDNLETLCRRCHATVDAIELKNLTGNDKARYRDYTTKLLKKNF